MSIETKAEPSVFARMQHLFDLWSKFDRVYFKLLQKWNMSYNTYLVLEELHISTAGEEPAVLADRLNIPRQTMTFVLDNLEKDARLERLPHPVDRRRKLVRLTEAGQRQADEVCNEITRREVEAMQTLSATEQEQLLELYDKLSGAFERSFRLKPEPVQ